MLSWSSQEHGAGFELGSLRRDASAVGDGADVSVAAGVELLEFASAATEGGQDLETARSAVARRLGVEAMVDAAAVVANFEMMTRLADGTGARMTDEQLHERRSISDALGVTELISRR